MALIKSIGNRNEMPYFQPPPLHIRVLKMCDQLRVITWDVKEGVAKPLITKLAAITDGEMVLKITKLNEFSKVQEGVTYMIGGMN